MVLSSEKPIWEDLAAQKAVQAEPVFLLLVPECWTEPHFTSVSEHPSMDWIVKAGLSGAGNTEQLGWIVSKADWKSVREE